MRLANLLMIGMAIIVLCVGAGHILIQEAANQARAEKGIVTAHLTELGIAAQIRLLLERGVTDAALRTEPSANATLKGYRAATDAAFDAASHDPAAARASRNSDIPQQLAVARAHLARLRLQIDALLAKPLEQRSAADLDQVAAGTASVIADLSAGLSIMRAAMANAGPGPADPNTMVSGEAGVPDDAGQPGTAPTPAIVPGPPMTDAKPAMRFVAHPPPAVARTGLTIALVKQRIKQFADEISLARAALIVALLCAAVGAIYWIIRYWMVRTRVSVPQTTRIAGLIRRRVGADSHTGVVKDMWQEQTLADDALDRAAADAARIGRIIGNLLANARKFTPAGSLELAVSLGTLPSGGPALRIAVTGTGTGMPAEAIKRRLKPYARAGASAICNGAAGLSSSRRLARMLGGDIGVTSTAGRGRVFTLSIPLVADTPEAPTNRGDEGARKVRPRVAGDQETSHREISHRPGAAPHTGGILELPPELIVDGDKLFDDTAWRDRFTGPAPTGPAQKDAAGQRKNGLESYIVTAAFLHACIRDHIESGDRAALQAAGHRLAGTAFNAGAMRVAMLARDLEEIALQATPERLREQEDAILAACNLTSLEIRRFTAQQGETEP